MTATKPATPLPWENTRRDDGKGNWSTNDIGQAVNLGGFIVARTIGHGARQWDDSAYIVHAANAYPRLVEDAKADLAALEWAATHTDGNAVQFRERIEAKRALLRELGELS